jgi:glutaredoxin-like YruB-family protein
VKSAWLTGLVIFCLVAGGWILVQGRSPGDEGLLSAALLDRASEEAEAVASELGLTSRSEREPASFYRYTDAAGTMRFVRSLAEVPADFRDSASEVSNDRVQRAPSGPAEPRARAKGARAPVAQLEERALQHEVVVYTTSWCGWCRKTLAYLEQQGVPFENRDIEAEDSWREELLEKTGGTSIPVVEIDGQIIRGYDPQRMAQLLGAS